MRGLSNHREGKCDLLCLCPVLSFKTDPVETVYLSELLHDPDRSSFASERMVLSILLDILLELSVLAVEPAGFTEVWSRRDFMS